jgi:hypothetical protein
MGTVDKIFLKFPYKWWPDNFTVFSVLKTNDISPCIGEVSNETVNKHKLVVSPFGNFLHLHYT